MAFCCNNYHIASPYNIKTYMYVEKQMFNLYSFLWPPRCAFRLHGTQFVLISCGA